MADLTITVRYSCPICGVKGAHVVVPARTTEDVLTWMEATGRHLSDDHAARSPHCHPRELHDIMIPMTGADRVGGAPVQ